MTSSPRPAAGIAAGGAGETFLAHEIPRQGSALRTAAASFASTVEPIVAHARSLGADDWVVTGCGDSLFAGMCAEVWCAAAAGVRLRAVHAMELSRYLYPALTERSVVIAVSHSGTTARVIEAARAARSRGAYVVALTSNADSELAAIADLWVDNAVRAERSNTRTASFQAVALFMRTLATVLAGGEADAGFAEARAAAIEKYVGIAGEQVAALPAEVLASTQWCMVGAGPSYAVAQYGTAKLYEAATVPAHVAELEQLIHCEIFTFGSHSTVVIVAPRGRSISRARELAVGLGRLGVHTVAVTDDEELADSCSAVCMLPAGTAEEDVPFLAILPLQWLALRVALARGENPDLVSNKWINRPLIDDSQQWDERDYSPRAVGTETSRSPRSTL